MYRYVDFANSFLTFSVGDEHNVARIQLDAICTVEQDGQATAYHLIAPCRSEYMYRDKRLFQMPNYDFRGIWTETEYRIIRTGWTTDRDGPESGDSAGRFAWTSLEVRTRADVDLLESSDTEVVEATLAGRQLVAVTLLDDKESGIRATIEYPVKTMNVAREPDRFQVDTGPLILPDFASSADRGVDRLDLAHVVYWKRDRAEFVVRKPVPVAEGSDVTVTDYSEIRVLGATNQILAVRAGA
jgi:hypothetical protein